MNQPRKRTTTSWSPADEEMYVELTRRRQEHQRAARPALRSVFEECLPSCRGAGWMTTLIDEAINHAPKLRKALLPFDLGGSK